MSRNTSTINPFFVKPHQGQEKRFFTFSMLQRAGLIYSKETTSILSYVRFQGTRTSKLHTSQFRNLTLHKTAIAGVSKDVSDLILKYANSPQTGISLQTLMKTGRGELIHKTYKDEVSNKSSKVATDKILIQVAGFLRHELPIRLAHRIEDLGQLR